MLQKSNYFISIHHHPALAVPWVSTDQIRPWDCLQYLHGDAHISPPGLINVCQAPIQNIVSCTQGATTTCVVFDAAVAAAATAMPGLLPRLAAVANHHVAQTNATTRHAHLLPKLHILASATTSYTWCSSYCCQLPWSYSYCYRTTIFVRLQVLPGQGWMVTRCQDSAHCRHQASLRRCHQTARRHHGIPD